MIKIIVPLNEQELARVALKNEVKAAREGLNPLTHDVVVEDDAEGNPVVKVKERTQAEKDSLAANIYEPEEATQAEIDAIDPATHKVTTLRAGFLDGSIRSIQQIVEKTDEEKLQYEIELLKDKVKAGTATAEEMQRLELLTKI